MGDFYWTGIEIWAGFGPVEKKRFGAIMGNFLGYFFPSFHGQKKFNRNILKFALNSATVRKIMVPVFLKLRKFYLFAIIYILLQE